MQRQKKTRWLRLAVADTLLVGGIGFMIMKRYLFGMILVILGIVYRIKYVD